MKKLKFLLSVLATISLVTVLAGCNIFDFASDAEQTPEEKAEEAIRDGDYAKARKELQPALKDSTNSMALYLSAKVALLDAGINLGTVLDLVEGQDNIGGGAGDGENLALLGIIDDLSNQEKTNWYRGNVESTAILTKIWNQEATGLITKEDISLDYTISNMMSGVLGLRDTNRDGIINGSDFQLDLSFISNIASSDKEGFNISGASFIDEISGEEIQLSGLEAFLGNWSVAKAAAGTDGISGYTPDDINNLLAFVLHVLDTGLESILFLFEKQAGSDFDAEQIEEYLGQIAGIINFYWYHDGVDNDSDGSTDEEIINGVDDDGDGLTDEDTGWHPADPTNSVNTDYIELWREWNNR